MKRFRGLFRKFTCIAMLIILILAGYNITLRFIYPVKYSEFVEKYSDEYSVNRQLVYAVIKSESNFKKNAVSSAGAAGLMQLTEETFNDVRIMLGDSDEYTYDEYWNDAEISIKYGTRYLKYLLDVFEYDKTAAVAAYNAGMGNVIKWLDEGGRLDKANIRFTETSGYVGRVLKAEKYYNELYK